MNTSKNLGGRPKKTDPCTHRYSFSLNDVENAEFLAMLDKTDWTADTAKFIKVCLLKREIKYVKFDKAAMDYYMRLTTFHSQFRAIGVNYNQVVKHLKATFTEKMALAMLYKLEKATIELVAIQKQMINREL
ncbi:MAG: hypothetical protein LBG80_17885 [Bacteroidales bacterium]|jgi:hypothetical protein|nr:hypothetical protein [Bacteroidales bacterium]